MQSATQCAWEGCSQPRKSNSKSKYCKDCGRKAWQIRQEQMESGRVEREARYAVFAEVFAAGLTTANQSAEGTKGKKAKGEVYFNIFPAFASFGHWIRKGQTDLPTVVVPGGGVGLVLPTFGGNPGKTMAYGKALRDVLAPTDSIHGKVSIFVGS